MALRQNCAVGAQAQRLPIRFSFPTSSKRGDHSIFLSCCICLILIVLQVFVVCKNWCAICAFCQGTNGDQNSPPNGYAMFSTEAAPGPKQEKKTSLTENGASGETKIIATLAKYLWMKDNFEFRFRVIAALGLLISAKVNVCEDYLLFARDVDVLRWFYFVVVPFGLGFVGN